MPLQAVKPPSENYMSSSSETAGQAQAVQAQAGLLGRRTAEAQGGCRQKEQGERVREGWVVGAAPGSKVREEVTWR